MNEIILKDCEEIYHQNIPWHKLYGKSVLISGAYGMLASYVTDMLIYLNEYHDAGIKIIALVRAEGKCRNRFGEYADKPYFLINTSPLDLPMCIDEKVDFIIHAATMIILAIHFTIMKLFEILGNHFAVLNNLAYLIVAVIATAVICSGIAELISKLVPSLSNGKWPG